MTWKGGSSSSKEEVKRPRAVQAYRHPCHGKGKGCCGPLLHSPILHGGKCTSTPNKYRLEYYVSRRRRCIQHVIGPFRCASCLHRDLYRGALLL